MTERRLAVFIAVVLGMGVVAALGQDGGDEANAALASARQKLVAAGTARMETRSEFEINGVTSEITGDAVLDFARSLATATVAMPDGTKIDYASDGADFYVRTPRTGGWVRITVLGDDFDRLGGQDPLSVLDGLHGDLDEEASEDLRGVAVTHYSGAGDLDAALAQAGFPPEQVEAFHQLIDEDDRAVETTLDVYADARGLVHRVTSSFEVEGIGRATSTMDLRDFGEPVEVSIPAEGEVVRDEEVRTRQELSELLQSLVA